MERIIRNSQGKLLAFVVAFAVVFMSIGVLLPATVKAGDTPATEVDVGLTLPEVGQKASTVTGSEVYFYAYDDEGNPVEIESDMGDYSVEVFTGDALPMGDDAEFEADGTYTLVITVNEINRDEFEDVEDVYIGVLPGVLEIIDDPQGSYAVFTLENIEFCKVTFDSAGGSAVAPQYVLKGDILFWYWPDAPVRDGYEFDDWLDEDGYYYDFFEKVLHDITLTANWIRLVDIISGDNQTFYLGTGGDVVITFNADYNNFVELWIYNNETEEYVDLSKGGFSVTAGSTVLTLNESLLKTMEPGEYTVGMLFMDNNGQESVGFATLNIAEGEAPATTPSTTPSTTPATGDSSNIIAFAGMAGAAALGFAAVVIYRKKVTE